MRQSYLDYAMSVIVGRALPDVRDGLIICKGFPKEADFKALDNLADTIARKHKDAGLK